MKLKKHLLIGVAVLSVAVAGMAGVSSASNTDPVLKLSVGNGVSVECSGGQLKLGATSSSAQALQCVAKSGGGTSPGSTSSTSALPTSTTMPSMPGMPGMPTTPGTPAAVGTCGESMDEWHPAVINGCNTGHDHGDAPPAWIKAAGYDVKFMGMFNTSSKEDTEKHAAMKGFSARFGNVDVYFRVHIASNAMDRSARYHSYEVWARDASGAVSHWQGWFNSGDPATDRFPRRKDTETSTRPAVLVVDQESIKEGIDCEQWYGFTTGWSWDFGWTICGTTTLYQANENATPTDQSKWLLTGDKGATRRLEAAWYTSRSHPTGKFYATQFGDIVSSPQDAKCKASTTEFGVSYPNVCLEQYIAPTMQQVSFPNNAVQKTFDVTGVKIPN